MATTPRPAPATSASSTKQDALGSVYALTNLAGPLVEAYQYDAYGHATVFGTGSNGVVSFDSAHIVASGVSQVANPFLFTGLRFDAESGLYFAQARYLDPIQGRFLQQDPLGYQVGSNPNLYAYVADRPTFATDPSGEQIRRATGRLAGPGGPFVYSSVTGFGPTPGGVNYSYLRGPVGPFFNPIIPFAYFAVFNPFFGIFGLSRGSGSASSSLGCPSVDRTGAAEPDAEKTGTGVMTTPVPFTPVPFTPPFSPSSCSPTCPSRSRSSFLSWVSFEAATSGSDGPSL